MSVQIKLFGETKEVIEAGLADKIHDLMMAVMVLDFTDITAGIKSPVSPKTLESFAAGLESWAEKKVNILSTFKKATCTSLRWKTITF